MKSEDSEIISSVSWWFLQGFWVWFASRKMMSHTGQPPELAIFQKSACSRKSRNFFFLHVLLLCAAKRGSWIWWFGQVPESATFISIFGYAICWKSLSNQFCFIYERSLYSLICNFSELLCEHYLHCYCSEIEPYPGIFLFYISFSNDLVGESINQQSNQARNKLNQTPMPWRHTA